MTDTDDRPLVRRWLELIGVAVLSFTVAAAVAYMVAYTVATGQ